MFSGKLPTAILLLFVMTWPHVVTSTGKATCTMEQKQKILEHCISFTERGTPYINVHPDSVCCEKVRMVPNRNMVCIAKLLTDKEMKQYDVHRILGLKMICQQHSPLPKQNKKRRYRTSTPTSLSMILSGFPQF
ncbi:hypothetical protein BS78_02G329800 [Paspalum vaginatum]|nr:hypothetical protein BS78_02G329800 [Paspalum vaginatum]